MSDYISRKDAIDAIITLWANKPFGNPALTEIKECVEQVPSAQPERLTDDEIQRMQDLEQAQIGKAYQLGYEEGKNDAQPERKKGKWINTLEGTYCDNCNQYPYDDGEYRLINWRSDYCPNCGADMRGEKDGQTI